MKPSRSFKTKFKEVKSSKIGLTIDITLRSSLIAYAIFFKLNRIVALIIGVLTFTA